MNDGIDVEALRRIALAISTPNKKGRRRTSDATGRRTSDTAGRRTPDTTSDTTSSSAIASATGPDTARSLVDAVVTMHDVPLDLVGGRGHYERVIDAIRNAHTSVWIATANVKELMIEDARARPGRRRTMNRSAYVSVLSILDELSARDVELRLLHAEIPSRPFREEIANHPRLLAGGLALRRCPRVHMKIVVVDGELLYLGSANWTGAGLGAKGSGRRNFELGITTSDSQMLDQVQRLYDHVWRGAECDGCKLRAECPGPLSELGQRTTTVGQRTSTRGQRTSTDGRRTSRGTRERAAAKPVGAKRRRRRKSADNQV